MVSNRAQDLAARIKQLGLQQQRIAEIAGLDEATVSQALTGRRNSLSSTIDRIAAAVATEEDRLRDLLGVSGTEAA